MAPGESTPDRFRTVLRQTAVLPDTGNRDRVDNRHQSALTWCETRKPAYHYDKCDGQGRRLMSRKQ